MSQYGPYLLEVKIVKRGRPSSTKGPIGCVSLVYQLLKGISFSSYRIKKDSFLKFIFEKVQVTHSWVATYIIDKC